MPTPPLLPSGAASIALLLAGCMGMPENDRLEVGGVAPTALQDKPDVIGRQWDEPSVVSLDRSNWGERDHVVPNHWVSHRPTYARRNTRFEVSGRASGEFPTLADAMTLPRGPSESEQIYDAVTWPILIVPAAFLVPLGVFVEPPIATVHKSPQWEYQRHTQQLTPGERTGLTGDPFVDRLGLPVIEGPTVVAPWPVGSPVAAPTPPEPSAEPDTPSAVEPAATGGGR